LSVKPETPLKKFILLPILFFGTISTLGEEVNQVEDSITITKILRGIRRQEEIQKSLLKNYFYYSRTESGGVDKDGEIEVENIDESRVFVSGNSRLYEYYKIVRKGKAMSGEEMEKNIKDSKKRWEGFLKHKSPFSPEMEEHYDYQYLWEERLGDRMTYLLKLNAREKKETLINGFFWIDQETFGVVQSRSEPAKNPKMKKFLMTIKSLKTEYSAVEVVKGIWLPRTIQFNATGGVLFIKKKFGIKLTFEDYQLTGLAGENPFEEE
jgi:hypothetical protein